MNKQIISIRKQIDRLDEQLVTIIAGRISLVKKIGEIKKENNLPVLNINRRDEVVNKAIITAEGLGISEKMVGQIFRLIHKYSLIIERGT